MILNNVGQVAEPWSEAWRCLVWWRLGIGMYGVDRLLPIGFTAVELGGVAWST
jgi:hypothetical protein